MGPSGVLQRSVAEEEPEQPHEVRRADDDAREQTRKCPRNSELGHATRHRHQVAHSELANGFPPADVTCSLTARSAGIGEGQYRVVTGGPDHSGADANLVG